MKYIIASIILVSSLFALPEAEITPQMKQFIAKSVQIASNKEIPIQQRAEEIFKILDPVFDYSLMARISLGSFWDTLNQNEQYDFAKIFEQTLKNSYISKLDMYNNQKINITEAKKIKENRIWLYSFMEAEKENLDIIYKFYSTKKEDWLIYDVDIVGVSILQTYRAQFADFLKTNSFEKLKQKLINNQ